MARCYKNDQPEQGLLYSWKVISRYLGVSDQTARKWRNHHGLPVARMPNGQVSTTKSLIDQWLLSRCEYETTSSQEDVANLQHAA